VLLTVDIGNSTIGAAIFALRAREALPLGNIATAAPQNGGQYLKEFRALLDASGIRPHALTSAIVSSVVPAVTDRFLAMLEGLTGVKPLLVRPALYDLLPVKIPASRSRQIGTDIVCNAVEAWARFQRPCIIVDFGTALTFTALGVSGGLLGAAIAPGLAVASRALAQSAAQLFPVALEVPPSPLGENTVEAMQSGLIFGCAGLAESLIGRFMAEMRRKECPPNGDIAVIATGGLCGLIAPLVPAFLSVDTHLIFYGLRRIADLAGAPRNLRPHL
jgi:type III pantothenate kinase